MDIRRFSATVEILAPAKVNLFFEVLAKRSDGFHEIETLMCPINWYDTITFHDRPTGDVVLRQRWAAGLRNGKRPGGGADLFGELPAPEENLVMRAVTILRERSGCRRGAEIQLIKRIPAASGLGGGSSDAAAALVAANAAWRLGWTVEQLVPLAAELGSDVPFFLQRGAAVCRGRGEQIESVRGVGPLHLIVVRPPAGLSTADVYSRCQPSANPRRVESFFSARRKGITRPIGAGLHNELQSAAETCSPWIGRLRDEFEKLDLLGHQMSGSGTSYFGICRHARHARCAAGRLRARNVGLVRVARNIRSTTVAA